MSGQWQFWIDRGGTFTDIVAQRPDGSLVTHKLLSENPDRYPDAPIQGIRDLMGLAATAPIPVEQIAAIKMGTTVATNALLERKGDRVVFVTTAGFRDVLRIGYQNRPDIFALHIRRPELLYERVIEAAERLSAHGEVITALAGERLAQLRQNLQAAYAAGIRSCAIALLHGYRYPRHEAIAAAVARAIGFTQISVSHQVSPLIKLVSRGDTTVVDAYLSPILRRYVDRVTTALALPETIPETSPPPLFFMQSNGGLVDAAHFQGKDSILSGPAGGIVGAVQVCRAAGFERLIGFDMGGTSTDVARYAGNSVGDAVENSVGDAVENSVENSAGNPARNPGEDAGENSARNSVGNPVENAVGDYERQFETEVAGVRLRAPMLAIHTVAAGGGSILHFDGQRYRVGPDSAGANPGPAAYGRGGPLTITDANVCVGKLQPDFFPAVFGPEGDRPLDVATVRTQFAALADRIHQATGDDRPPEAVAAGFLAIAVATMAQAIQTISIQRGYDVADDVLCCFGGAGGQHACAIAAALGMETILIHPYAGVLSAYGMGLADERQIQERAMEQALTPAAIAPLLADFAALDRDRPARFGTRAIAQPTVRLRYAGTDSPLVIALDPKIALDSKLDLKSDPGLTVADLRSPFETLHRQRYGFALPDQPLVIEAIALEWVLPMEPPPLPRRSRDRAGPPQPVATRPMFTAATWHEAPIFRRDDLQPGDRLPGPAAIIDATGTSIVEPGWTATVSDRAELILQKNSQKVSQRITEFYPTSTSVIQSPELSKSSESVTESAAESVAESVAESTTESAVTANLDRPDPVQLELFNHRFRAIAEQMGVTLQNTSYSVNIKERLDFSCAIFDAEGQLVANAPHIPVHLGSMGDSVAALIRDRAADLRPGDVYATNNPYNGGTHLPDITVITPVFLATQTYGTTQPPAFYVASRGHHADIGGITPGSMPAHSTTIAQEGILIDHLRLVRAGEWCDRAVRAQLCQGPYPVRNLTQNLADLQAQIAANNRGVQELRTLVQTYGAATVRAYMAHIQTNAADCVRRAIAPLSGGSYTYPLEPGGQIQVTITIDHAPTSPDHHAASFPDSNVHPYPRARIDFSGTSPQQANNFNAPRAVVKAAVLYVFRTLVADDIPLNAGCLAPLDIVIPSGSTLDPREPAAIVAGNVETSQAIVDALYGALGILANSQGTMNNLTFGSDRHQYYETICGGAGAGATFPGTDAVHTHMTNSRLTDPEVLEWRFPVRLDHFEIRPGSGGAGTQAGGCGVRRQITFLEPMTVTILSSRRAIAPAGLAGGQPGQPGVNQVIRSDGTTEMLGATATVDLAAGEAIAIETPGGGGFGCLQSEESMPEVGT